MYVKATVISYWWGHGGGGVGGMQWENCVNDTNKKYNPLPDHPKLAPAPEIVNRGLILTLC